MAHLYKQKGLRLTQSLLFYKRREEQGDSNEQNKWKNYLKYAIFFPEYLINEIMEIHMRKNSLKGSLILLLAALIWGCAFVAQSAGMDYVGPYTFMATRSYLGVLALVVVNAVVTAIRKKKGTYKKLDKSELKTLLIGGTLCGCALCSASCFQQFGICYTSVGKAGFITAMYILIVPVLGLFFRRKVKIRIWICIAIAIAGLYLLCVNEGFSINGGDILLIVCAFLFSVQIMLVDHYVQKVDGIKLSLVQFSVTAILSTILMFIFEEPKLGNIADAWLSIAYAGIMSSGVAYTLQIVGQKITEPTIASLLMSMESVFATLGGVLLLHQFPSGREWGGIACMFVAIMASQMEFKKDKI